MSFPGSAFDAILHLLDGVQHPCRLPILQRHIADSACALQNMMLTAESMDIGSCWINQLHWLDENQHIRDYLEPLGLGTDETICGAVALGNYDGTHARKPRTGMKVDYIK